MKKRLIVILVPIITLVLALAGGFEILWRFFVFLLIIMALSYVWTRISIRGIKGTVEGTTDYCRVGDNFEEYYSVTNDSRIPTAFIEVNGETDLPGYGATVAVNLPSKSSHSWYTGVRCTRRGRYNVGVITVTATDPLGLFSMSRQFGKSGRLIVYPEVMDLPFFQAIPRLEPGASPHRWLSSEISPNASRVREYSSGDSLRHIHWHSTAHTGALMVKEFDPDRSRFSCKDVWIFPDMHRSVSIGEGSETMEEYIITTAASLIKKYIDSEKQVGMIATGDHSHCFLPKAGKQHMQKMLHTLAEIKASGNLPISKLLTAEIERFDTGSVIVVITSSDNREIIVPLRRAMDKGAIVMVILLDSFSFGGDNSIAGTARSLLSNGITVYIVRRGVDIVRALDSRVHAAHT
jgi:uncharacterized protein (DUF58 family)